MVSMAPGQVVANLSLLSPQQLRNATAQELSHTEAALLAEQHRRALEDNDVDAVLEDAFVSGFTSTGQPQQPWISGGLLVCPGFIRYKSKTSHECCFVSVGGTWVWEHEQVVRDLMRQVPGPRMFRQSVSVLVAQEGMEVDQVHSVAKSGAACQMDKAVSFQVRGGELVQVTTRAAAPGGHRRG